MWGVNNNLVQAFIDQSDPWASHLVSVDDALHPAGHTGEGVLTLVDHIPGEIVSHVSRVHQEDQKRGQAGSKWPITAFTPLPKWS